jgi:hypothetical protein
MALSMKETSTRERKRGMEWKYYLMGRSLKENGSKMRNMEMGGLNLRRKKREWN